jgi:hypothetical protein
MNFKNPDLKSLDARDENDGSRQNAECQRHRESDNL